MIVGITLFQVHLSSESLIYGECLIRYNYTEAVELVNSTNVPAMYEVLLVEDENITLADILIDATNGVIAPFSQNLLKITIATRVLGQISLSLLINISGRDSNPLILAISACSIGPTLQLEQLNLDAGNPNINLGKPEGKDIIVNYGNVHVLENNYRTILVRNLACIPADVKICLCKKHTVFFLEDDFFTLEPFGSQEIKVR